MRSEPRVLSIEYLVLSIKSLILKQQEFELIRVIRI